MAGEDSLNQMFLGSSLVGLIFGVGISRRVPNLSPEFRVLLPGMCGALCFGIFAVLRVIVLPR
ncbi:hypothetical protein MCEMSE15_01652 [Fimbriimonadaceae bacterium]